MFKNLSSDEEILNWIRQSQAECRSSYPLTQTQYEGNKKPVAVDVGANVGGFCISNSHLFDNIYAFEPYQKNFELIKMALESMEIKNVTIFPKAVHSKDGETLSLKSPNLDCSGDITCVPQEGLFDVNQTCTTITLEKIMSELKIDKIDYLKMDCEGSEYDILENFNNLDKVDILCLEIHGTHGQERKISLMKKIENTHHVLVPAAAKKKSGGYKYGWTLFPISSAEKSNYKLFQEYARKTHNIFCLHKKNISIDDFDHDMFIMVPHNDTQPL